MNRLSNQMIFGVLVLVFIAGLFLGPKNSVALPSTNLTEVRVDSLQLGQVFTENESSTFQVSDKFSGPEAYKFEHQVVDVNKKGEISYILGEVIPDGAVLTIAEQKVETIEQVTKLLGSSYSESEVDQANATFEHRYVDKEHHIHLTILYKNDDKKMIQWVELSRKK